MRCRGSVDPIGRRGLRARWNKGLNSVAAQLDQLALISQRHKDGDLLTGRAVGAFSRSDFTSGAKFARSAGTAYQECEDCVHRLEDLSPDNSFDDALKMFSQERKQAAAAAAVAAAGKRRSQSDLNKAIKRFNSGAEALYSAPWPESISDVVWIDLAEPMRLAVDQAKTLHEEATATHK
jgi:hypothetical protein